MPLEPVMESLWQFFRLKIQGPRIEPAIREPVAISGVVPRPAQPRWSWPCLLTPEAGWTSCLVPTILWCT